MGNINKTKFMYYGFMFVFVFTLIFFSIKLYKDNGEYRAIKEHGAKTVATVCEVEKDNYGKYPSYTIYLKYAVSDSLTVTTAYRRSVSANKYKLGEHVNIIYDKRNPIVLFFENDTTIKNTIIFLICDVVLITLLIAFKGQLFKYYQQE